MNLEESIYETLGTLSIPFELQRHPPIFTWEDAQRIPRTDRGQHFKSLFLTPVRQCDPRPFFLLVICAEKRASLQDAARAANSPKLTFANPGALMECLGVTPGAVSPLALIHPGAQGVQLLLDSDIPTFEWVSFHPGVNTATVTMPQKCFQDYIGHTGHVPLWI